MREWSATEMQDRQWAKNSYYAESLQLRAEQVSQLYKNAPVGLIASPINAAVLSFVLRNVVPSYILIAWLASIVFVTILRLFLLDRYRRAPSTTIDSGKWGAWFIAGAGASGIAWGSAGIVLFPDASIAHQTFIAFVLGGMSAGAAAAYAVVMPAFLAYAVPALSPAIIRFFATGGEVHIAMGVMVLLFLILVVIVATNIRSTVLLSLRLRFENRGLVADMQSSMAVVKDLNAKLAKRRESMEKLVEERTAELAHANAELKREIAERKRAEEEVRVIAARFQSLIENGHDMITVLDAAGTVLYESPSIERLLGYEETDLLGMNIFEFIHPEDHRAAREALARVAGTAGRTDNIGVRLKHKNGSWRLMDAAGKSYVDIRGDVNVIVNSRDVTERRLMEDSLHRMQKLESLGVFAGGLAHDLNNVLMGIEGNIDVALLSSDSGVQTRRLLEQAMKAADRAKALTNQLITFSKGGEPVKRVIAIGNLIEKAAGLATSGTNVDCETALPEGLWSIEADEDQIVQVFCNILINAVQAMPEGGTVRIGCENVTDKSEIEEATRYVKVTITDEGTGIPTEHLGKIFDPYFTTKTGGSGLGLAAAYSIAKRHGGRIAVESEPGRGASFHIYLPAAEKSPEIQDSGRQGMLPGPESGRILLMDDEQFVRDVAGEAMRLLGYDVALAREGEEALDLYRRAAESGNPFDVVILDLTVPGGMGGKEAAAKLLEMNPGAKVVVSSGYSDDPIMARFREYGFAAAVAKPYKVQDISETLQKILSK